MVPHSTSADIPTGWASQKGNWKPAGLSGRKDCYEQCKVVDI